MEAAGGPGQLRREAIGLPQVLFQSVTHMAPGAAIAFSIFVSIQFAGPALPLSVLLALVGCACVAASIGQLAKEMPSAGGLYTYVARALGPQAGLDMLTFDSAYAIKTGFNRSASIQQASDPGCPLLMSFARSSEISTLWYTSRGSSTVTYDN